MNGSDGYAGQLSEALDAKIRQMDGEALPQLKEHFKIMLAAFQGIHSLLLKKGIIHDDPYRFDSRYSEVNTPPEGSFTDAEKTEQMSIRISQFMGQLDFLTNYYQFSIDFLNMDRVKRLIALTRYFNFSQVTVNSTSINTRFFAEMIDLIRKGSDQLSSGVINDSLLHLERSSKSIMLILKDLTTCHKEILKREYREQVLGIINLEREHVVTHQEEVLRQIKRKFSEIFPGKQFFSELAVEVLKEDYSQESAALRATILADLHVKSETKKNAKVEQNFRLTLLEALRVLSSISLQLDDCDRKLEENSSLLEAERNTFWEKVKKAMRAMFNRIDKSVIYEVDFTDPVTTAQRTEKLDFTAFRGELQKKSKLYSSLNPRSGNLYQRMEASPEEQLYSFVEKNIEELQIVMRRLQALDLFFRSEVQKENRSRLHGIKLEMEGLKNTIIKANQKKHEYVAQHEELEQMKRLGIKTESA